MHLNSVQEQIKFLVDRTCCCLLTPLRPGLRLFPVRDTAHHAGETSPLTFSLAYAAPEVIAAFRNGERTLVADPAADMWALGIIAYEILTKERVFLPANGSEDIIQRLLGEKPLLWEGDSPALQEQLRQLRGLRRPILQCLDRDPARRPTSAEIVDSWNRLFDMTKTVGGD
jgi:serine/threonine protein kinase